ncbi:hypothetical protein BDY19DRAFT_992248 [Irpex rosettiformis]|uniref:Uncharacterized protein n=1 Tax=Irpex rosettiformis TaxID=378272 RepID=A0ACB8U9D8_9APHY|nr:hypothetical protein BDY19DRAFT_992248 [Irpex rosettiformis]
MFVQDYHLPCEGMDEAHEDSGKKLPAELTDAILDQLRGDKSTLLNCAVVCSSWLQTSRYHLFHTLRIDNSKPSRSFSDFVAFIRGSPHICAYIHSLSLQGNGTDAIPGIGPILLSQILRELPSLCDLELDNVIWERATGFREDSEPCSLTSWPLKRPCNSLLLRRLRSCATGGRTCLINDIFDVLSTFSSLKSFTLERITYSRSIEPPAADGDSRVRLEQLDISTASEHGTLPEQLFFNALRARVCLDTLSNVNLRCSHGEHAQLIGSFLRDVNPTNLTLDLSHMDQLAAVGNESIWSSLGLASLTSLKSLSLHVWTSGTHLYGDVFTFVGQWCLCSVLPILSHISPTVERVTIILSISGDPSHLRGHLEQFDWQRLLNEFNRLTALEAVVFEIRQRLNVSVGDEATSTVAALVETKLSALVASGVLEVI